MPMTWSRLRCRRRHKPRCGRTTGFGSWRCLRRLPQSAVLAAVAWRFDGTRVRRRQALAAIPVLHGGDLVRDAGPGRANARRDVRGEQPHRAVLCLLDRDLRGAVAGPGGGSGGRRPAARRSKFRRPAIPRRSRRTSSSSMRSRWRSRRSFPGLRYDKSVDPFFQSHDGKLHKLRVETFGGASWLTEFSVLTGLSAHSFGGMRTFVQVIAAGKVRDTLPQALGALRLPQRRALSDAAEFRSTAASTATGFHKILDAKDQRATLAGRARPLLFRQRARRDRAPSQDVAAADVRLRRDHGCTRHLRLHLYTGGERAGRRTRARMPEVHEYLRRLGMAAWTTRPEARELDRRFPDRAFLIVHYGDHQPTVTRRCSASPSTAEPVDRPSCQRQGEFITYYAMDA